MEVSSAECPDDSSPVSRKTEKTSNWDRTGAALARSKALNHYHVMAAYFRQVQCAGSSTQYQNKQGIIKIFLYNNAKTIIVRLNDWIHAIVLGSGSVFFNH